MRPPYTSPIPASPIICLQLWNEPLRRYLSQGRHRDTDLVILFGGGRPGSQMPAVVAMIIDLVLDGELAEMSDDVLHLGVTSATALPAKIVKPRDAVH